MHWTICQWLSNAFLTPLNATSDALTAGIRGYVSMALTPWEILYFCGLALSIGYFGGGPHPKEAIRRCLIVALLGYLIVNAAAYNTYIRDVFLTKFPNDINTAISGAAINANAFDKLMEKAFTAGVVVFQNLPMSWISIPIGCLIILYWGISLLCIFAGFLIYATAQELAAVCIPLGPLMLAFFMVAAVRGVAERWLSVLISSVLVQYLCVAITSLMITTEAALVTTFAGENGDNIYDRAAGLVVAVLVFFGMAYMLKQIPAIALAIAGGIHFHVGAITGSTIGRAAETTKTVATTAATGGAGAVGRAAVAAIRNRISGPPGPSLSRSARP